MIDRRMPLSKFFKLPLNIAKTLYVIDSPFSCPFKHYQRNNEVFFDADDEFVDILDDDEEEVVDIEQPMDSFESENTEKSIEDKSLITSSSTDMP